MAVYLLVVVLAAWLVLRAIGVDHARARLGLRRIGRLDTSWIDAVEHFANDPDSV